jgi:hypothetical protein
MTGPLILGGVLCEQAIQSVKPTTGGSVTVNSNTAILLLNNSILVAGFTVNFPASPINGQYFTIVLESTGVVTLTNAGGSATVANGVTSLNPVTGNSSVTYLYVSSTNTWYRM